ncbi:APC family permease [Micromonospora sp. NPDC000089]|uniref:APC family permease n=1 Tax=unclassified Micromonospora TaxID=2617518 RepID=UPI003695826C
MSSDSYFTEDAGLRRGRLGTMHLVFFVVAASAPLTVLGGGVTTMYAVSGNIGAGLSFLLLAAVLGVFAIGYAAMSRYVTNAGAFYSYIANGLGRAGGVAGSAIAMVAYNTIQIGLYGLFGAILADFMKAKADIDLQWWAWALAAWVVVAILGLLRVDLNATVLAVLLVAECVAVLIFDFVAIGHPADGVTADGFLPTNLFSNGFGAVLALGIASFTGFESGAIYSEEVRDPKRTVARATFIAVAFTGLFYGFSAWAMTIVTGPANTPAAAAEAGPGLVFGTLAQYAGNAVADIANVLFITSVFAALLSFHNGVARYLFALGREGVLPAFLATTSRRTDAPIVGSLLQSALAVVVFLAFAFAGRDPVVDLFTWLSGSSAVGVVLLMTLTSAAVLGFFRKRPDLRESTWRRAIAPALGTILLAAVLLGVLINFESLLAPGTAAYIHWTLIALPLVAGLIGLLWGLALKSSRPQVYANIGRIAEDDLHEPGLHPTPQPAHRQDAPYVGGR